MKIFTLLLLVLVSSAFGRTRSPYQIQFDSVLEDSQGEIAFNYKLIGLDQSLIIIQPELPKRYIFKGTSSFDTHEFLSPVDKNLIIEELKRIRYEANEILADARIETVLIDFTPENLINMDLNKKLSKDIGKLKKDLENVSAELNRRVELLPNRNLYLETKKELAVSEEKLRRIKRNNVDKKHLTKRIDGLNFILVAAKKNNLDLEKLYQKYSQTVDAGWRSYLVCNTTKSKECYKSISSDHFKLLVTKINEYLKSRRDLIAEQRSKIEGSFGVTPEKIINSKSKEDLEIDVVRESGVLDQFYEYYRNLKGSDIVKKLEKMSPVLVEIYNGSREDSKEGLGIESSSPLIESRTSVVSQ